MGLWIKRFSAWILEPIALFSRDRSEVLISLTIFMLGLFSILFPNHLLEADGTWLSIMGSVMAIFGFDEILVSLGKPSFFSLTWAYIKRFPIPNFKQESKFISLSANDTVSMTDSCELQVRRKRPEQGDPLEQRIDWLESERDCQEIQIQKLRQDYEKAKTNLSGRIDSEVQQRVLDNKTLDNKIIDLAVGGIPLNLLGLFCIIVGIVLLLFSH